MKTQFLRKSGLGLAMVSALFLLFSLGCGGGGGSNPEIASSPPDSPIISSSPPESPEASSSPPDSLVAQWNETAMSLSSTLGSKMDRRALAMMHTAIYDAVTAFDSGYHPYHVTDSPPAGASQRAAAAAAAYHILSLIFTTEEQHDIILARYDAHLSQISDGQSENDGIAFGQSVAQTIWLLRSDDGALEALLVPQPEGTEPGEWRRTGTGTPAPSGWGQVRPWAMTGGDQFDQGGPLPLSSQQYAGDYNETFELGKKISAIRTAEQSRIATFWNPDIAVKWNVLAREISEREALSLAESARLFGLLSVTLADSAISGWNMKAKYNFWRPETAIREGENDGNPETPGDAAWEPFLRTPAQPEYVSGHSLSCAAAAAVLGHYLGTDAYTFALTSPGIPEPRTFTSFEQAAEEAGLSRVYGGVHFQSSTAEGLQAGKELSRYIFDNFFRPRQS